MGGRGLHIFTFKDIPVFVSGWYFLLLAYIAYSSGVQRGLLWASAITISLLVHEFGHALVARRFRLAPEISLEMFGGLTHHQRAARDRDDALVIAAGPAAGIAFGVVVLAVFLFLRATSTEVLREQPLLQVILTDLLYINFFWSFVNLLPLWPLDGGQLFRLGMLQITNPAQGERVTHIVGAAFGVAGVALAYLVMNSVFVTVIAALLTFQNVRRLSESSASGPIRARNRFARELMKKAEEAFESGDYEEAARLAHQARVETTDDSTVLDRIWKILAVSTTHLERYEEALSYIHRARLEGLIYQAKVRCILSLGRAAEAAALLAHPEAPDLPLGARQALENLTRSVTTPPR